MTNAPTTPPQTPEEWNAELLAAIKANSHERVLDALSAGADPNTCTKHGIPAMFTIELDSYSSVRNRILQHLLNYGANPQTRDPQGDSMLHLAALYNCDGAVAQMLEAGIDANLKNRKGMTALSQTSDYSNPAMGGRLRQAMIAPRALATVKLTHDSLFARNGNGDAPIDNCLTWKDFEVLTSQLEKNGEPPLTKEDLMQKDKTGTSYLARAILSYRFDTVQAYLQKRGEGIDHHDLIRDAAEGGEIGMALVNRGRIGEFFNHEYWQGKSLDDFQMTYRALGKDVKSAVTTYHAVHATLSSAVSQQVGR